MLGNAHPRSTRTLARSRRGQRASTLIELLVVIFMIAVLMSMLIPSLKRSMEMASKTVCQTHLRELGNSVALYRYDNEGWLPTNDPPRYGDPSMPRRRLTHALEGTWFGKLYPTYIQDAGLLVCPADPYTFRWTSDQRVLFDPAAVDYPSYGMSAVFGMGGNMLSDSDHRRPTRPLDTILLADLGPDDMRGPRDQHEMGPGRNGGVMVWDDGDTLPWLPWSPWLTTRHNKGINMLTLEGRVESVRTVEMLRTPLRIKYDDCAAGGCTFCNYLFRLHYSFAKSHLYWWTGTSPLD